jgi:hypothetical protein
MMRYDGAQEANNTRIDSILYMISPPVKFALVGCSLDRLALPRYLLSRVRIVTRYWNHLIGILEVLALVFSPQW